MADDSGRRRGISPLKALAGMAAVLSIIAAAMFTSADEASPQSMKRRKE